MKAVTRTIIGSYLNNCMFTGRPFKVIKNTTLNEKLGINVDLTFSLPNGVYPTFGYYCIGNGGHKCDISNGISVLKAIQHHSTDLAPFNMIPFVLRELDDDLPPGIRERYALRRIEEYGGVEYIAYYLKRIDFEASGSQTQINNITIENGVKTSLPFVPTSANLSPKPQIIGNTGVNVLDSQYVEVSNEIVFGFTPEDNEELRNVANILYNDEALAIISEFGLVTGVDQRVTVGTPGALQITYNEVICAQMSNILTMYRSSIDDNLGWKIYIRIGSNLPLYLTTNQKYPTNTTLPSTPTP